MTRLKNKTKANHSRLEKLQYFKELISHKLPVECYVRQLRALAIIHGIMEYEIATCDDELLSAIWEDDLRKLPLLLEDILHFKHEKVLDCKVCIEAAQAMAEKMRFRKVDNPVTLFGYLYTFEGSTLGNKMHRKDISATFHLDKYNGSNYYASYRDKVEGNWKQFSEKVNNILSDTSLHDQIIEASYEAYYGLEVLYNALFPIDCQEKIIHVTSINPEAGNHAIPENELEIQAALKASEGIWNEFPYYQQRYGERGRRFSDSDMCWLVTLIQLDIGTVKKQIKWIGGLLSGKGMPQILLEQTLLFLHKELIKANPDNKTDYDKLFSSAQMLKELRIKAISEKAFEELSNNFEQGIGRQLAEKYKNFGILLVSAVADEKNEIGGALLSIYKWMTDKERFSESWISAVDDLIKNARLAVKKD